MTSHFQVVVAGGGNAGISVAARLMRRDPSLQVVVIDPSDKHYYQPAWTLVGSGLYKIRKTARAEQSVIPDGVKWIQQRIVSLQPEQNALTLDNGDKINYDFMVLAVGIQLNWHEVKGLPETLGRNNVCSNYGFDQAPYTFECIRNFKGGNAIFTSPHTPVKCGGAPQKIMYMAADYFRRHGLSGKTNVQLWSGGTRLFGVPKYEQVLLKVCERDKIALNFHVKLTAIDGERRKAVFTGIGEENKDREYVVDYDMIHITPPQSAPDFIRESSLANPAGWVDVDKYSLQHVKYANVFSLGDVAALPTGKTGAAVRKQAPVLVQNLLTVMAGGKPQAVYNGYSSCPVLTGYGKLVLAEFDYNNEPVETFPFNQAKERWTMYILKRYILPWLYWHKILQGKA